MFEKRAQTVYVNRADGVFGVPAQLRPYFDAILKRGWTVVNAARPLPGRVTWVGKFRHGSCYAAGPEAEYGERWRWLDGWPVVEVTNDEVREYLVGEAERAGTTLEEALAYCTIEELAAECGLPWQESAEPVGQEVRGGG